MKFNSILSLLLFTAVNCWAQVQQHRAVTLMGSRFDITIVAPDTAQAKKSIDKVVAEITRIENLISDWKPHTQISEVNDNAGIMPVKVDKEVFELTKRSLYFSELTQGAFDISYAAMDKIWRFDGSMKQMPSADEIKKSVANVGYQNVVMDSINCTIFLKKKGMKIGFGATGKGYAADRGSALMQAAGIKGGIVNASGDMATWGTQSNGKPWLIGLTHPFEEEKDISIIKLTNGAVVTSGSYEKYVEFEGKRYAHIINPLTGYPASGLISATVLGPNAEQANGFSTSIMVLGKEKGVELMQQFPEYAYMLITDSGEVVKSSNFSFKVKKRLKK